MKDPFQSNWRTPTWEGEWFSQPKLRAGDLGGLLLYLYLIQGRSLIIQRPSLFESSLLQIEGKISHFYLHSFSKKKHPVNDVGIKTNEDFICLDSNIIDRLLACCPGHSMTVCRKSLKSLSKVFQKSLKSLS